MDLPAFFTIDSEIEEGYECAIVSVGIDVEAGARASAFGRTKKMAAALALMACADKLIASDRDDRGLTRPPKHAEAL